MKLIRGGAAKKMAFEYACKVCGVSKCTDHQTAWGEMPESGNTVYLDKHNIQCPTGKGIRNLQLFRDSQKKNIQWRFQCCFPGTTNLVTMPIKKVLIGGLHNMKYQRKIPGNEIPWSNANHFTISYWIKTNPATEHWRSIFRWGNSGSKRAPAAWLYCCRHSYKYSFKVRTQRCCGTNVWIHGGNDGVDVDNLQSKGFRYYKWSHILTTVNGRHVKHYINGKYLAQGWLPDYPQMLKSETMHIPDWTGDHNATWVRNMWWHDGSVNDRQIREIYTKSKFNGWDAPREIPHKVLIDGEHHLYNRKVIPGNQIPLSNQEQYTIMYWIKTNPADGHWRNIFRWGNNNQSRAPAAWFWCCGHLYRYHFRIRTQRCCGSDVWVHGGNDGVDANKIDRSGFRYDKWNHMCTIVNRKLVSHYINGKYHSSGNLPHYPQALKTHNMYIPGKNKSEGHKYTWIRKMMWFDGSLNNSEVSKWYNNTKFIGWNTIHWRQKLPTIINKIFKDGAYIALWNLFYKKYLKSGSSTVRHVNMKIKKENVYQVKRLPGNMVALWNITTKKYIRANTNVIDESGSRGKYSDLPVDWTWERFEIEYIGEGRIAFYTYHKRYIKAEQNSSLSLKKVTDRDFKKPSSWTYCNFYPIEVRKSGNKWLYDNPYEPFRIDTQATGSADGHFEAEFYINDKKWKNSAGVLPDATEFYGNPVRAQAVCDDKIFPVVRFGRYDGIRFDTTLCGHGNGKRGKFTVCVVGRNLRSNGRLIDGTTNDVLHGWWQGRVGVVHHGHWCTSDNMGWKKSTQSYNFHCVIANSDGLAYVDGEFRSKYQVKSYAPKQWTINAGQYHSTQWATGDIAEMIFWNKSLTHSDLQKESRRLTDKYSIRYWGRYVWVHTPGDYLHMRKVKVFGSDSTNRTRLVSENKTTTGDKQGWSGNNNRVVQSSWPGDYANHSHIGGWWQVDLGKEYSIDRIEIWNRIADAEHASWRTDGSCCRGRFGNAIIRLKNQTGQILWERKAGPDYWHVWCPGRDTRLRWDIMGSFQNGRKLRIKTHWGNYVRMNTSHGHHGRWRNNGGHDGPRIDTEYHLVDRTENVDTIFQIAQLPKHGVNCIGLLGANGRWLRARKDEKTIDQSSTGYSKWEKFPPDWKLERFYVHHVRGEYFALKTFLGTWLSAHRNGHMVQSPKRSMIDLKNWRWERFSAIWLNSNYIDNNEAGFGGKAWKRPAILSKYRN